MTAGIVCMCDEVHSQGHDTANQQQIVSHKMTIVKMCREVDSKCCVNTGQWP